MPTEAGGIVAEGVILKSPRRHLGTLVNVWLKGPYSYFLKLGYIKGQISLANNRWKCR
jgi:hypothetical protein